MNELLDYFKGDQLAADVWKSKYAAEGENTPSDAHRRQAKEFAKIRSRKTGESLDFLESYFFNLLNKYSGILPQGRVQAGLGVDNSYRSLSNCLRLPPPQDSYNSIMKTDNMLVSAAKRGCGYGIGLSNIRPEGALTTNASKTSTGVLPFGQRYSNSTNEVGQEGRRGACLEDLDIRHPDAPRFAIEKLDKTKLTGANISFKIWSDFIKAVENDEDYILRFPCDKSVDNILEENEISNLEYNILTSILCDDKNVYVKRIKAKELWDSIIHGVWSDGCPGLQFWERIVNYDPVSVYKEIEIDGTNACGEQPKAVYDTCRLIALNLFAVVVKPFEQDSYIDYDKLYNLAYEQLVLGDDLIDLELQYVERIINKIEEDNSSDSLWELELWQNVKRIASLGRRIGCGITALADTLAAINISYDSDSALETVEKIMYTKMKAELTASIHLAQKYGAFPLWDKNLEYEFLDGRPIKGKNDFYQFLLETFPEEVLLMCTHGRRNANWSTIAPVGTMSIVASTGKYCNLSSGCEPQFMLWYYRNKKVENSTEPFDFIDEVGIKWKQYPVLMGAFKLWFDKTYGENLWQNVSPNEMQKYYEKSPWFNCTANMIDWKKRVDIQAVLQKYTTSAISSTLNLAKDIPEQIISDIYMYAFEKNLKGVTCYRDGSKGGVLVNDIKVNNDKFTHHDAPKRPKKLDCDIYHVKSKGVDYTVLVGLMDKKPYEIFTLEGMLAKGLKKGQLIKRSKGQYELKTYEVIDENLGIVHIDSDITSNMTDEQEALTRLTSTALRHGANVSFVVEQLNKTHGDLTSFSKVMSRCLKHYITDGTKSTVKCSECGSTEVIFEEGCKRCMSCGHSACG